MILVNNIKRRVVVTGIGLATSLGSEISNVWNRLMQGDSGISTISLFNSEETDCKVAGEIKVGKDESCGQIDLEKYISIKEQAKTDRFIHFAYSASTDAFNDASLCEYFQDEDLEGLMKKQSMSGTLIGSGIGGLPRIEKAAIAMHEFSLQKNLNSESKVNPVRDPFFIPACLVNLASGHISMKFGLKGPNMSIVTACASGANSIGESARLIKDSSADIMVCGGSEAAICKLGIAGFASMKALSTKYNDRPQEASKPWHKDRDGFVMGEGAGILILEDYEHAKNRKAKIYAELVGYGVSADGYHISAPHPEGEGGARAMQNALKMANLKISDIDYINAHGTSTPAGDVTELKAIKNLFELEAKEANIPFDIGVLKKTAISSTKSSIGHLLGAAGAVEVIFAILAMQNNEIPPTLNVDSASMEEFALDFNIITKENQSNFYFGKDKREIKIVASNSFGFGGTNACLIFKKLDD